MIGNLKESALPYMLEHMRLAKMSFDLWGALSPMATRQPPGTDSTEEAPTDSKDPQLAPDQTNIKRSMSQAELESSLYKVRL